jgi:hypothetical protein
VINQFPLSIKSVAAIRMIFGLDVLIQPFQAARKIAPISSSVARCVINQFPLRTNSVVAISNILDLDDQISEETSENDCCV